MNTFIWFTYNKNEELLMNSILSIVHNIEFEKKFVIAYDNKNGDTPSQKTIGFLENIKTKKNISYDILLTKFNRNGNLMGKDCSLGMLDIYFNEAKKADIIFKLDDDCLVLNDSFAINSFMNSNCYLLAPEICGETDFHGCFYGMKTPKLNEMEKSISLQGIDAYVENLCLKNPKLKTDYKFAEDRFFAALFRDFCKKEEMMINKIDVTKGFFCGWKFYNQNPPRYYNCFDVVTYGNRKRIKGNTPEEKKAEQAKEMEYALQHQYLHKKGFYM